LIFQATDDGGLTNIFKELNSVKTTFEELDKTTLSGAINAFNNTSVSVDDLSESFGGLDDSVVTYLNSTERGQASIDGLSNSMYNSASSMSFAATKAKLLAGALNMITGIAITLAIQGIVWAIDELIVTMDEQKEKLDDAIQAYEESETELKNINDELKTTQERIDELNAKDNLTFTEQDELEKLVKTNDELERKIFLLEQANKEAEKKVVAEVQDTYDKYTKNRNIGAADQIDFYTNSSLLEGVSWDTYKNDLSWLIAQYKKQEEILSNAQANGWDDIEENARNNLELLEGYMSEASQDYQDLYDKIGGISEYAMTDELKDAQQDLNNILDITAEILGYGGERAEISFDDIWNSEDFSSYKIELENLAKEGKLDASVLESNENYKKLLENTGATAEDTAQHINALVDEMKQLPDTTSDFSNQTSISFEEAWNNLDTIEVEEYKNVKEELLALAEAGKLSYEALSSVDGAEQYFKDIGISVVEATRAINEMVTSSQQLSSMRSGITAMTSALGEKESEGMVSADTLGGFDADIQGLESWTAFQEILGNVHSSMEECQEAANKLATEYVNNANFLSALTEENKDYYISQLNEMGVMNAEQVVIDTLQSKYASLALEKEFVTKKSIELANATVEEINQFIAEQGYSQEACNGLMRLALAKQTANGTVLDFSKDISNIIGYVQALGGAITYLNMLNKVKAGSGYIPSSVRDILQSNAKKEVNDALNGSTSVDLKLNIPQYKGGGSGGSGSNKDSLDKSSEELKDTFEEVFDWIERRLKKLQRQGEKWLKYAESAFSGKMISEYYRKLRDNLYAQMNTQSAANDRYMIEADKSGLSEEYKRKVRDGSMDIETITDETLANQIKSYQEWYDKAIDAMDGFEEAVEQRFNIPIERCAQKVEEFAKKLELLDAKLKNAIGYKSQNKLISQNIKQEKEILKRYKRADYWATFNVNNWGNQLLKKGLNSSDVSEDEKKLIKSSVKNKEELDMSMFEVGTKAYELALKYNYALKASVEAAENYKKAQEEYTTALREARKQQFDNVANEFENKIGNVQNKIQDIDNQIAEIEGAGKRLTASYYKSEKKLTDNIQSKREKELKKLKSRLDKMREAGMKGSDDWYDALNEIQEVENSISECTQKIYELNNAITDLHYDIFNDMADAISRVINEQEFLQSLFEHEKSADNETGIFTEAGLARLSSTSAQYYLAKEKAEKDEVEIKKLQALLAKGADSNGIYSDGDVIFNSIDDLQAKIDELYTTWQDDIQETYNLESEIVDLMKEKYQAELEMVQQLINDKKEALQAEKDLYSYQKSIKEKTTNINTLQRQLAAYSGDTSEEGMAKRQQLSTKLTEAKEDLKETEYERYLSDQESMLDNLATEYEELITKKLEDFQGLFQEGVGLANENLSQANEYLSSIAAKNDYTIDTSELLNGSDAKANAESIVNKLEETALPSAQTGNGNGGNQPSSTKTDFSQDYMAIKEGQIKSEKLRAQLEDVEARLKQKNLSKKQKQGLELQKANLTSQLNSHNNELNNMRLETANKYVNEHLSKATKAKSEYADINKKLYAKFGGKVLSSAELKELAGILGITYDNAKKTGNLYKTLKQIHFPGFSKGGTIVSVGAINKRIKENGDDALASVKVGESILTPVDSKNLANMVEMFRNVDLNSDMVHQLNRLPDSLNNVSNLQKTNTVDYGGVTFNFELANVTNADEFIATIQNSKKVQKALQSVTVDRMNGGGRLSVRSVK